MAYGKLTANELSADYRCICKGGIGLMISWFPDTMPHIYNRLNPLNQDSIWEFSDYTPDIVVVNLMQNDAWLINNPKSKEFKQVFADTPPTKESIIRAYKNFILLLRNHYPETTIICALGNMDITKKGSPWPTYVEEAKNQLNDPKIHTLIFPYKETTGHPTKTEQEDMAHVLVNYIKENLLNTF